jgi:hypothetical protein
MHEHKDCNHKLEYCKVCDVAYCEKCGREWGTRKYYYTYPNTWIYTNEGIQGTLTVADSHTHTSEGG